MRTAMALLAAAMICGGCEEYFNLANEKDETEMDVAALAEAVKDQPGNIIVGNETAAGNLDTIGGNVIVGNRSSVGNINTAQAPEETK